MSLPKRKNLERLPVQGPAGWPRKVTKDLIVLRLVATKGLVYDVLLCYDDSVKKDYMGHLLLEGETKFRPCARLRCFDMDFLGQLHAAYIELMKIVAKSTHTTL